MKTTSHQKGRRLCHQVDNKLCSEQSEKNDQYVRRESEAEHRDSEDAMIFLKSYSKNMLDVSDSGSFFY